MHRAVAMEWLHLIFDFIVDVLEAVAWPTAIAFVVVKLRDEIETLVTRLFGERLTRLQAPGVTAEFSPQPQDTEAENEEAIEVAERALPTVPAQVERIVNFSRERTRDLDEAADLLGLQLYFERVFRVIYRSQMELLEGMERVNDSVGEAVVSHYHGLHVQRADEYALDDDTWLQYLYQAGFIEGARQEGDLRITEAGVWFLAYCRALGYSSTRLIW